MAIKMTTLKSGELYTMRKWGSRRHHKKVFYGKISIFCSNQHKWRRDENSCQFVTLEMIFLELNFLKIFQFEYLIVHVAIVIVAVLFLESAYLFFSFALFSCCLFDFSWTVVTVAQGSLTFWSHKKMDLYPQIRNPFPKPPSPPRLQTSSQTHHTLNIPFFNFVNTRANAKEFNGSQQIGLITFIRLLLYPP